MDPSKRASVGTRVEEQVKDWLRYGEELGLGPYYRDRAPLHEQQAPEGVSIEAEPAEAPPVAMAAAAGASPAKPSAASPKPAAVRA
ncbi:MAG: hypothetical protein WB990_17200, partial [Candidatus Acidiferrales bacterium]